MLVLTAMVVAHGGTGMIAITLMRSSDGDEKGNGIASASRVMSSCDDTGWWRALMRTTLLVARAGRRWI